MDKKLFAVLLGGKTQNCNIELHDLVFVVGSSLEETYPKLVNKWFGTTHKKLHVDSSLELDIVDGYRISLSSSAPASLSIAPPKLLHCVNFGGYQAGFFGELHEVKFYVDNSKKDIIKRAKQQLCVGTLQQHCDDNFVIGGTDTAKDVDDVITVGCVDGYHIHLTPTTAQSDKPILSHYRRLDVPSVLAKVTDANQLTLTDS